MMFKRGKIKNFTFLVFDDYKYREVKSFKFNINYLIMIGSVLLLFIIFSIFSCIFFLKYFSERSNMLNYKAKNKELRIKMEEYDKSLAAINEKSKDI